VEGSRENERSGKKSGGVRGNFFPLRYHIRRTKSFRKKERWKTLPSQTNPEVNKLKKAYIEKQAERVVELGLNPLEERPSPK